MKNMSLLSTFIVMLSIQAQAIEIVCADKGEQTMVVASTDNQQNIWMISGIDSKIGPFNQDVWSEVELSTVSTEKYQRVYTQKFSTQIRDQNNRRHRIQLELSSSGEASIFSNLETGRDIFLDCVRGL